MIASVRSVFLIFFIAILLFPFTGSGCDGDDDDGYYLTIYVNGNGTTEPSSGSHYYDKNQSVTITATPAFGWNFNYWSGHASSSSRSVTVTMDGDKSVTAYFIEQPEPEPEPEPEVKRVCIDPGHGGSDPGTLGYDDMIECGTGCEWEGECDWIYDNQADFPNESDINLDIALKVREILRQNYFEVVMTRETDTYVSLQERTNKANRESCDIFVSIHGNAQSCGTQGEKTKIPEDDWHGTSTYFYQGSTQGSGLADCVQTELVWRLGLKNLGTISTQDLYVLENTTMPAVLVEVAYLTNKNNFDHIRSHTQDAAQGIANAILKHFGRLQTFRVQVLKEPETYKLTVSSEPYNAGYVEPAQGEYTPDTVVTLRAKAYQGYDFDHWGGDATGDSASLRITMDANKNIVAYYDSEKTTYTLVISVEGGGTTTPVPGIHLYDEGEVVSLEALPELGWVLDYWEGDAFGNATKLNIRMDSNKSITAHFKEYVETVSDVEITSIFYDGLVPRYESDEYVEITNVGNQVQDLYDWVLKDISDGHPSFTFPHYLLGPGESIRVYTDEVHSEYGGFSFGYGRAVWNNTDHDTAVLCDTQGQEVSRKSY